MTSPDGYVPDGAVSDTGLAAFATKTQYSWQADLNTQLKNRFLPAQLGFLNIFGSVAVAQQSANFANVTNTITKATNLAAGVSGGVAVNDPFSGSAASTLGASWTRTSDGSGAGTFGPNGSGSAVWTTSGNGTRRHVDRYNTPLSTGIQAVMALVSTAPANGDSTGIPYTYLLGRMNSSGNTFVYCRISNNEIAVGKCVSGTWFAPWKTQTTANAAGDQFSFLLGTNGSLSEMVVIKNGYVQIQHTDVTGSATGNLYVGVASQSAPSRSGSTRVGYIQKKPGALDVWAAADRQSSVT
jgi:hypothetical protein